MGSHRSSMRTGKPVTLDRTTADAHTVARQGDNALERWPMPVSVAGNTTTSPRRPAKTGDVARQQRELHAIREVAHEDVILELDGRKHGPVGTI